MKYLLHAGKHAHIHIYTYVEVSPPGVSPKGLMWRCGGICIYAYIHTVSYRCVYFLMNIHVFLFAWCF